MSAVPKTKISEAEYLERERKAEFKSEYYRGEMFAIAGASRPHNRLNDNLVVQIGGQLRGGPCWTYSRDMRVSVAEKGLYTYPDLVIVCGTEEFDFPHRDTLLNPAVVFEILSEATESYDRGPKFRLCQSVPSLREYILVSQIEPVIERFVRQANGDWLLTNFVGLACEFALATVAVRVPMADIYAGIEFPEVTLR